MSLFDSVISNASFQNMAMQKLKTIMQNPESKFLLLDFSSEQIKIEEFKEHPSIAMINTMGAMAEPVLIEKKDIEFLKTFYNNNKDLKDAKF